jgi:exodeoxyribonuclease VII small subunit
VAKKKPPADEAALCFEDSLAQLEQLVAKLEGGKLGLAESLAAYEQGVQRLNGCFQLLAAAERRIELVKSVDGAGRAKTTPLDDGEVDNLTDKAAARSRRRSAGGSSPPSDAVDDARGLF